MTGMARTRLRIPGRFGAVLFTLSLSQAVLAKPPKPEPAPKSAPASVRDTLSGAAQQDYDLGRILVENGDYAGALVKFQHAFELSSDPRLLWDIGVCEKNLRHYAKLLGLMNRYLEEGGSRLSESQREDATAVEQTVRSLVSSIRLSTNVEGAAVFVDNEQVGVTPLKKPVLVDLGERHIRLKKAGYLEQEQVVSAPGASEVVVSIALEKELAHAHLTIAVQPSSATIVLDGAHVGTSRWQGLVTPGRHRVVVSAPDMLERSAEVDLAPDQTRSIELSLAPVSHGSALLWWIGGSVVAAAGLSVGGYFLFHSPEPTTAAPTHGTIGAGYLQLPSR